MIRKITNQPRDYAWGSHTLIPEYFGVEATGEPMAEVWFGTHEGSPTSVAGENRTLLQLRDGQPLPFLLKILAAGQPLSIQAHPNLAQAAEGFERENEAGIALTSAERDYKDANHKPEMIVALTAFRALIGFRPNVDIAVSLRRIALKAQLLDLGALEAAVGEYVQLVRFGGVKALFRALLGRRGELDEITEQLAVLAMASRGEDNVESANLALVPQLQQLYPGDPGVVISQLLNLVVLAPMQAAELPAGNVHAYLSGLAVEVMASSDNVLRGGLTGKHINVEELSRVVDFGLTENAVFEAVEIGDGLWHYPSATTDYKLFRAQLGSAVMPLDNAAIVLCTGGSLSVAEGEDSVILAAGEAAYVDGTQIRLESLGESAVAFIATF